MVSLEFKDYEIWAADLGPENYMPEIGNPDYVEAEFRLSDRVLPEDAVNIGKGMVHTILPYTVQDGYNRDRKPRNFHAAILENDKLRAVFLPELGGRLWSLYHKGLQRELLYRNPIFQPANLALRNAWFSGGVEWNLGVRGHTPFTCSSLHACRMEGADGSPVLRMYEFERIRGVVYAMDFLLPEGSDVLYARITIENTEPREKYMYWWSNIAVPETPDTRVIVPADKALKTFYREGHFVVDSVDIPCPNGDGVDCTYPQNGPIASDYFFRIPREERKWITAVEKDGRGLLQFSTPELMGRKLFLWGQGRGGRNWNRWLAGEPRPYIEIQAGLARTQYEHFPMAGNSRITWVEGYSAASFDPARLHGDYSVAARTVDEYVSAIMPQADAMHRQFEGLKMLGLAHAGSGWGYVESRLREQLGEAPLSTLVTFPREAVTEQEAIWLEFLRTGILPSQDLQEPPFSFQGDRRWLPFFARQIREGKADAYTWLQYGITLYTCGQIEQAREAFEKSNDLSPNAWACRNLAMLEKGVYHNPEKAADLMEQAAARNNRCRGLMVNCGQTLLAAGRYGKWIDIFDSMEGSLRSDSRLLLYKAMALLELQQYQEAAGIIHEHFVLCDVREGEVSLSHIWKRIYTGLLRQETGCTGEAELNALLREKYPLPAQLDFQMDQ